MLYGHHFQQSMNQPGKVANLPRRQLFKRENMNISLSPFAHENLASRDGFGRPVPRQPTHFPNSRLNPVLTRGIPPASAVASVYLNCHTRWGESRVYRVTQMRTDGVHCRESAGTGPVVLKVVPVTGAAFSGFTIDRSMRASLFTHPLFILLFVLM